MNVYTLDPLADPRWAQLVSSHPSASVFHTVTWLQAIHRTYGYTPVVYTTCRPSEPLSNGIVLCQIRSWLTGRRMVSLPFSDHCDPLLDDTDAMTAVTDQLWRLVQQGKWQFVELRPQMSLSVANGSLTPPFCLHVLDLTPGADDLFRKFHKDCIQRKVRRAEREDLEYRSGNSQDLLEAFYRLLILTRRKHGLPPQPREWFTNLGSCLGDQLTVRMAFSAGKEIAGIVTLQHGKQMVYKYGASDPAFQQLGGTPLLFWRAISEAKAAGLTSLDLGRSDLDNPGLITFKNRLGAKPSTLVYSRLSRTQTVDARDGWPKKVARHLFAVMPDPVLRATGRIMYRHVG